MVGGQSLLERCIAQVGNELAVRKADKFEFDQVVKFGALMHTGIGREVDPARIKACKRILKERAAAFTRLRGTLQFALTVKMALADDPADFIDGVADVYGRLKSDRPLSNDMLAMTAMLIAGHCPASQRARIADKTRKAYAQARERYDYLTGELCMPLIALMILAGKDVDAALEEAEGLFAEMKENRDVPPIAAQSAALVLALADGPADRKLEDFLSLYSACKEADHATPDDKYMVIYAVFAGCGYDPVELASAIGEVDDLLKKRKGYGAFGIGKYNRRLFAAALVLEEAWAGDAARQAAIDGLPLDLMALAMMHAIADDGPSR